MQIFHGTIITCNEKYDTFEYLVENHGIIEYVGNQLPKNYQNEQNVIELGERALCPSFGDEHKHFSNWALIASQYFDDRTARDFQDIKKIILKFVKTQKIKKIAILVVVHLISKRKNKG
jgi:predicted amidohydrolase YtcJ